MNPSSDTGPTRAGETFSMNREEATPPPSGWISALMALVASRVELIQLESKEVAGGAVRCLVFILAAVISAIFAWAILVAGGISLIAKTAGWPWNWVAIGVAIVHLLAAVILARLAKPSGASVFPVTRAEFQKDREWIENLQKPNKSKD